MSEPAICCGIAPMRDRISPPMPAMRIFRPLMSSSVLISLRYQPPICTPVLPPRKEYTL